jgi:hypothetical protein
MLPYLAQTIDTVAIENVIFVAKSKNDPGSSLISINGSDVDFGGEDWELYHWNSSDIVLDTPFVLSVDQAQLNDLDDLMMIVKYGF